MPTVNLLDTPVNSEERKIIARARRAAARHHLRLVKSRRKTYSPDGHGYQLQSMSAVATGLKIDDVLQILRSLDGR
jgi:hypothetical protein